MKNYTEDDFWLPTIFIGIVLGTFFAFLLWLVVPLFLKPVKSLGYGGSDGHLSPNEVEELYNKNRK